MNPSLYLDTARLGQMTPAAQRAQQDFASLAGEVGGAIQFEDFLKHGLEACNASLQGRVSGLKFWKGIAEFKRSLRVLSGVRDDLPLLLAARSAELMKLAGILLCRPCSNILVTDLGWQPYHRILHAECRRTNRKLTTVSIANDIFSGRITAEEAVERVRLEFLKNKCDGLFLTAVSSTGARLPIKEIVQSVDDRCRFAVVDGAQDFCHVRAGATHECCDLYLTGCHKWLGGYHPLGVACYGRRRSRYVIETVLGEAIEDLRVDDPLLRFVERLEGKSESDTGETVNLTALFSSCGAVHDAYQRGWNGRLLNERLDNVGRVADIANAAGWSAQLPNRSLRSGILILQASSERSASLSPEMMRRRFQSFGVTLSAYERGVVRLSMPAAPFESCELELLASALAETA